ncbi:MAG TPA: DUF1549 domain-containing protein [Planctomycetaceae bacterium]
MSSFSFVRAVVALTSLGVGVAAFADEPALPGPEHSRDMAAGLALFKTSVRSILVENCLSCHGGDATEGGFSLVDRDALLKGGDSGLAVVPRKAKESRLIALVTHADEPAMPMDASKLSDEEIAAITRWVDLGAPYDAPLVGGDAAQTSWTERKVPDPAREFWAFRPLAELEPPSVHDPEGWCLNDIDRFVLAKQREKGLRPSPPADRLTLIRRTYLDLVGMPPTPEEVDAFLADGSPDAYERLVDRLLDDERFGERWARHWLDVARFAESHGFEQDYDRPYAYHYRDFVIRAFNDDLPYDTFVRWQLAGDEVAPDEPLALMATGFVGAGVFPTQITANEVERTRYDALDDMAATTGTAFLGLSVGCARCHDHKFDPIPQGDYYRLISTFTTTVRSNVDVPVYPEVEGDAVAAPKPLKVMIASEGVPAIRHHTQGGDFLEATHYLRRGDCDQKVAVAEQGFLQVLTNHPDGVDHWRRDPPAGWRTSYRRRALAEWITDVEHGPGQLLARVIVNRLWHHHFGRGIVATPNDFGTQGLPPTHPELLDWLARRLIDGGWRLKPIHRLIVTSAAYRQSSGNADSSRANPRSEIPDPNSLDPQNEFLTRFAPRRLEAEPLRDSMLAVSGRLDGTMYGPGTLDEGSVRRSIYFTIKRSRLVPTLTLFDLPEPSVSIGNRQSTTIAPQALHFLNSPQARACAVALAERSIREANGDPLRRAYRLAYGREPTSDERAFVQLFLDGQTASYRDGGEAEPEKLALADVCQAILASNEFVYLP